MIMDNPLKSLNYSEKWQTAGFKIEPNEITPKNEEEQIIKTNFLFTNIVSVKPRLIKSPHLKPLNNDRIKRRSMTFPSKPNNDKKDLPKSISIDPFLELIINEPQYLLEGREQL